jgi:hypothetical protein
MLRAKCWIFLALVVLLICSERACMAQKVNDAYAIDETPADIPADWEPGPNARENESRNSAAQINHTWVGRRNDPTRHRVFSTMRIVVNKSEAEARACLKLWTTGNQVDPIPGAYTSKRMGDICFRGTDNPLGDSAVLWFCRANVTCDIYVSGQAGELDHPGVVEKIARTLLSRVDASLTLAATGEIPLLPSGQKIGIRNPRGVPLVLVDEWASGAGATWKPDWNTGSATVKQGSHTLILKVGSPDALLDDKPIKLAFPALRHGKDQIWCPIAVLSQLASG